MWFFIALSAVLGYFLRDYVEKTDKFYFLAKRYEEIGVRAIEEATNKLDIIKNLEEELTKESNGFYSPTDFKRYKGAIVMVLSHFEPDGLRDQRFPPSSVYSYLDTL